MKAGFASVVLALGMGFIGCATITPLHDAARAGSLPRVEELLRQSPQLIAARDKFGGTPLHAAVSAGAKDVAEYLLANGADVNARVNDGFGATPLHLTAGLGRKDITELLLAHVADVNARNNTFLVTPLHSAAGFGHKDVVELLLAKGADVNAKNIHGETPLDVALCKHQSVVVALLREHGARKNRSPEVLPAESSSATGCR